MQILEGIKNIIFDFGGVVINLGYRVSIDKFKQIGIPDFVEFYNQHKQEYWFDQFDTSEGHGHQFVSEIKKYLHHTITDEQVIEAWNAMLLDFPRERLELLNKLKSGYRTFLLSNTNEIHIQYYSGLLKKWYGMDNMDPLFEKVYYSYLIGMRKPDAEIFRLVLLQNELEASETLFIDDTLEHIESAGKCGIRGYHLKTPETITDLFNSSPGI